MTDAVILGNGVPPSAEILAQLMAGGPLLLCADGGANTAHRLGWQPHSVVGDLDSVETGLRAAWAATHWVRVDADDTGTDLQKVLRVALRLGVERAVLTGVTGGRTDHTLWNLGLLPAFAADMELWIVDEHGLICSVGRGVRFDAPPGLILSLCPLSGPVHGIHTCGLRWCLAGDVLVPGERDGISNEVVSSPVEIRVEGRGDLLLVIQREGAGADLAWRHRIRPIPPV